MKTWLQSCLAVLATFVVVSGTAMSQTAFDRGWTLEAQSSHLNIITVMDAQDIAISSFTALEGSINPDGTATVDVHLDSIETGIDQQDMQVRFLTFETYVFPKATVTTKLSGDMLSGLATDRAKTIDLPFRIDLHGVEQEFKTQVLIKLADNESVSITSVKPIKLAAADFNLLSGLKKLERAAGVTIAPTTAVTFSLSFARNSTTNKTIIARASSPEGSDAALLGTFDVTTCERGLKILSNSGDISFAEGSTELLSENAALLSSMAAVIQNCPDIQIEVAGHTDSQGEPDDNMSLSEQRAQSVVRFLTGLGVSDRRIISRGFGETQPVANNRIQVGRDKNRRIEFNILSSGQND